MGIPEPVHALTGHCSVIHDNTLYVYSPEGFQSLALEEGAEWEELPFDVSVKGGQCVKAVPGGDAAAAKLYIVGGTTNDTATEWNYPGLMEYTFGQQKWEWVRPETYVTQNRHDHAAIYLDAAKSILMYSGSQQPGEVVSSDESFLISTSPPHGVSARVSGGAPRLVKPILLPWGENDSAVMIGGGPENRDVHIYNEAQGWHKLDVTLTEPLLNQDSVQCALVSGDDGSKVLVKFDMSVSPNKVTRVALVNQGGTLAAPGTFVGQNTKRQTIDDWPAYNGTLAPNATRSGFSVAQDGRGMIVISGGNPDEPLSIFDAQENAWINATELFSGKQVTLDSTSSTSTSELPTSTSTSTPTASPSATETPPAAAPVDTKSRTLTVLGATLGAICGIAAILLLLLFCLKWRKSKNKKTQKEGYIEKDRLSFADRGAAAEFMKETGGAVISPYTHQKNGSQTSLAIISGRNGMNHKRGLGPLGSDASTAGLVQKTSPLGYSDPVELHKFDLKPEKSDEHLVRQNSARQPRVAATLGRSRSSGWSKYFANNDATNLANMPADRSTYGSDRTSTGSQSHYTDSRMLSQAIPPLQIPKIEKERVSMVVKGSPTLGHSQESLGPSLQPMQAELGRADSTGSIRSNYSSNNNYYNSGPVKSWTPVDDEGRPPSSTYTNSMIVEDAPGRRTSSYYDDGTSSFYPTSNYSSFYPGQTAAIGGTEDEFRAAKLTNPKDRESTATLFPRGVPEASSKQAGQQDMSWLNLGAGR